jgi:hypothetical protein
VGKRERIRIFGKPDVDGRIILNYIFKNWNGGSWIWSMWLSIVTGGYCKMRGFLD